MRGGMYKMAKITLESRIKRQDNTPWKEIEKEGIILKLKDGDYFAVNEVGLYIWKSLNGTKKLDQIAQRISSHYKINKARALSDLLRFIKTLHKKGLTVICEPKRNQC